MLRPSNVAVSLQSTLTGHNAAVYALTGNPSSEIIYSGAGDGLIVAWNLEGGADGSAIARVSGNVFSLAIIADSPLLLAGDMHGNLHLLDKDMMKEISFSSMNGHAIYDIQIWEGKPFVACGNGYIHKIRPKSAEVQESIQITDRHIRCLLPQAGKLLAGSSDNNIYCIDQDDWSLMEILHGHTGSVFSLAVNPHLNHLLSGGMDAQLRIWDNETLSPLAALEAHLFTINDIAFHPDIPIFATASRDKTIRIWDAHDYSLLKVLTHEKYNGHTHSVNKLFWSSVNGQLISCSDDRTIKVWDVQIN
jgi:WD repeat-containing protein 61